jgi:hypothetical protein
MRPLLAAALVLAAGAAFAQEDEAPRPRPREEVFRIIDGYIADNLQAKLGLGDEQLARALPLVRRLSAERRRFAERKIRALHQMRRMVRSGSVNDARAAELLQELRAAEAEEAAAVRAGQDALDAALTPAQQVRYRVLEAQVEHRLRELMARVRDQRRGGPGRRRGDRARESPAPR